MAKKLNEEYQTSMQTAVETKKIAVKASKQRMLVKKQKRQPSKTFLANQERRKMINFLKGSIGVKGEMFTNMAYNKVEELYKKEMAKLQGDSSQREEAERRMKERYDLNIQQPFPEETTPSKEKVEEKKEEQENVRMEVKSAKIVKTIASKKQSKKSRIEEAEKEAEPSVTPSAEPEQNPEPSNLPSNEQVDLFMTVIEPVQAVPISVKAPEVIFWDILRDNRKEYFRLKRVGDVFEFYSTWGKMIRSCSRADLEEMHKVGMKLYEPVLKGTEENLLKIAMEYLCMMFEPEKVVHRIKDLHHEYVFKKIDKWILFENCGVYMITIDNCYHEYYLVDKVYDHSKEKLNGMLKAKLVCAKESEMARIVIIILVKNYILTVELNNNELILGFMQIEADSERPLEVFVYDATLMCDEGDDEGDDGGDDEIHVGGSQQEPDSQFQASYYTTLYSDHSYCPNDSYPDVIPETQIEEEQQAEEEEEEDEERRFVGVAHDETHVFTTGISDLDRSNTDIDEDEEEETYTPSNKSFGELNDYFDTPLSLPNPETNIPPYQLVPYNRGTSIHEGQLFDTKEQMAIQLGIKFMEEGFVVRTEKSDKSRYVVICEQKNCKWRMSAKSVGLKGRMLVVRKLNDMHICSRTQLNSRHRQANKRTLGHILKGKFIDASRSFRPNDIVDDINQQGTPEESYERLPMYLYNLELKNPGTHTRIRTDSHGRFELCFAALGCASGTFLANLRPVLVIDDAHLKGPYLGMIFLAVAMNGNNNIVPLAFGVGKSETEEERGWFLSRLRECIRVPKGLVSMSDRSPSISAAISVVYPSTPHALCCRHLEMNVKSVDRDICKLAKLRDLSCNMAQLRDLSCNMAKLRGLMCNIAKLR
ncbi:hypothetical protein L6452_14102 [Arctium lappa]|uniref:Uncharacterized protein n=1 Tax=Arctium lappa TaxID=4217 RepID=A0ACB9CK44_ARCLA|nr:hypothetical protein L6452_14102 [Arctium lappa]